MFNLSPKVVVPFLAGLIGFLVVWVTTGNFDGNALAVLLATFGYGILGVVAPPVPRSKVTMNELVRKHSR